MAMQGQNILLESIQKLLRRGAERNLVKILTRTHAADIALVLRQLPGKEAERVFRLIPELEKRAESLVEADPEIQQSLVDALSDDELIELLGQMYGDDAADVLEFVDEERAEAILSKWKGEEANEVDTLLGYGADTAGGIMSPDVFALPENTNVKEAIETLQTSHEELEMAFYLYVVNDHGHLVGVLSLRQLVVSDPHVELSQIMATDVISVDTHTDQEDVARLVARYNFLAIPVVDNANRLVGIVTVDDIIDVIREEATEDMMLMAGAGSADLSEQTNPLANAKTRSPWLLASFMGGIGSMLIISSFEAELEKVAALAAFIPITIGMGGNVGTQAATIVTRGLALGRIDVTRFLSVLSREVMTGALLGVLYGVLLALVATALYAGRPADYAIWQLAATVSLSVSSCMIIAATVGGGVPILFERAGIDPAVATGPFVTTSVDIIGIGAYFMIGKLLLGI